MRHFSKVKLGLMALALAASSASATPELTNLYNFTGGSAGYNPQGGLLLANGLLCGTTSGGGSGSPAEGTIFSFPLTGGTPTILGSFNQANGGSVAGPLALYGGKLYGESEYGGTNGNGVVFSMPIDAHTLPPRQPEVLEGIRRGESRKTIAEKMGVSDHTVRAYEKAVFDRAKVTSRSELQAVLSKRVRPVLMP